MIIHWKQSHNTKTKQRIQLKISSRVFFLFQFYSDCLKQSNDIYVYFDVDLLNSENNKENLTVLLEINYLSNRWILEISLTFTMGNNIIDCNSNWHNFPQEKVNIMIWRFRKHKQFSWIVINRKLSLFLFNLIVQIVLKMFIN